MTPTKQKIGTSPDGAFWADYNTDSGEIEFCVRDVPAWAYCVTSEGTLSDLLKITQEPGLAYTAKDLLWLAEALASAETWMETIPHDLATFGEIGVSY